MEFQDILYSFKFWIFLFVLYLVHKYVTSVLMVIYFYKKQLGDDFLVEYVPYYGIVWRLIQGLRKHGDGCNFWKEFTRNHPGKKGVISNIGYKPLIEILDIPMAKDYNDSVFGNFVGEQQYFANPFLQMQQPGVGGLEGDRWKKERGLLGHAFLFESLKNLVPDICEVAQEYFTKWEQEEANGATPLPTRKRSAIILSEIILRAYFGTKFTDVLYEGESFQLKLFEFRDRTNCRVLSPKVIFFGFWITRLNIFPEDRLIHRLFYGLRGFLINKIKERLAIVREDRKRGELKKNVNILDYLLERHIEETEQMKEGKTVKFHLSLEQIANDLMDIIAGSTNGASLFFSTMTHKLSQSPEIREKIREEAAPFIKDTNNIQLVYDQVKEFKYMEAFVKESLRCWSPAPAQRLREATKNCNIGNLKILKETVVTYFYITNAYNDEQWKEDPRKFIPERWLGETQPYNDHYCFLPFGSPYRSCLAQNLVFIFNKTVFAILCSRYNDWQLLNKSNKLDMHLAAHYKPNDDVLIKFGGKN